ncbi:AAA-domain-containing protein [Teratosphaeria nubilosa]|uniref:AAA-domain-containing protein n=1 Tax=Teratosphaeria nubilosa TaxID=161662 RepID=A0A6G1L6X9_9PEZI|nr:AAA-domain-containing protein [Teratosphaeria nubilosa]
MMLRKAPASAMQKTYDEAYLNCSTAIYFEQQNNEAEALRSWRNALDQIYYHNAYKMPSSYIARTETEKALQDSLKSMELQCKERVDLLEALRKSRLDAEEEAMGNASDTPSKSKESLLSAIKPSVSSSSSSNHASQWLGSNTVPHASYNDLPRPTPPLPDRRPAQPKRPSYLKQQKSTSETDAPRTMSLQSNLASSLTPPPPGDQRARTPSPEKKAGGMLKTLRSNPKERTSSSGKLPTTMRSRPPPAAARAATQVWTLPQRPSTSMGPAQSPAPSSNATWDPYTRSLVQRPPTNGASGRRISNSSVIRPPSPTDYLRKNSNSSIEGPAKSTSYPPPYPEYPVANPYARQAFAYSNESVETAKPTRPSPPPPPVPAHRHEPASPAANERSKSAPQSLADIGSTSISYMKEYPNHPPRPKKPPVVPTQTKPADRADGTTSDSDTAARSAPPRTVQAQKKPAIPRKAVGRAVGVVSATAERQKLDSTQHALARKLRTNPPIDLSSPEPSPRTASRRKAGIPSGPSRALTPPSSDDADGDLPSTPTEQEAWEARVTDVMKNLPKGVDEAAAKQIFNEIVIQGDEVHWDDVAGLDIAKSALKETVVYPFLRPDLFMGLREPARGMLLFGPPGTGKTMLARAVATESKSIFFAISASSLTSKFLGESEKLVRALFALAKALAPSIIFVDEIDSLLGARGGGSEHEATRRIKTEFLIQWSDLQKAAAGREDKEKGDATRVLVLAATNLPWAIDEAARRRFVRRQYIPLPEDFVREQQLRTLLLAQKHSMNDRDLETLVALTDGFSGSDITALAKDAAMGPLRSLGEKLLHMSPEDIRPIGMEDFRKSLVNIRPSVSKAGLKEFEDWAREFGERGG